MVSDPDSDSDPGTPTPTHAQIEQRAYEIYLRRVAAGDPDLPNEDKAREDWCQAVKELVEEAKGQGG